MMKNAIKTFSLSLLFVGSLCSPLAAQDDITNILKAGVADFNQVANGYLKPAANSFAIGLGSNWYNTAEVHKVGGFDFTVGVGIVQAPDDAQFFDLTTLKNLKPSIAGTTQAPTFTGKGDGVVLDLMQPQFLADKTTPNPLWDNGRGKIVSFNTPQGVSRYIPTASLQLTVGLPFINDVSIRLVPKVSYDGFETSLWGVGIKHDFKRWIPGLKLLPFDAAVMMSYSKLNMNYKFSSSAQITPEKLISGGLDYIPDPNSNDYSQQKLDANATAFNASIIVSKKLLFFTPFAGFGMSRTSFNFTMAGNYPTLGDPVLAGNTYKMQIVNMVDPVKMEANEVMTSATLGFRLKILAVLTLHGQYTFQKYPVASVGFGVSIR